MATYRRVRKPEERDKVVKKRRETNRVRSLSTELVLPAVYQRTRDKPALSSIDVIELQRTVGNRATNRLLDERVRNTAPLSGRQPLQRILEEEELECPGSKIRSGGQGKGLGLGLGEGPVGVPTEEEWGERYGQGEGPIAEPEEDEWE